MKTKLTTADINKYLADGGSKCPFCNSNDIHGSEHDYSGDRVFQNITCFNCEAEWTDEYKLLTIQINNVPKVKA